MAVLAQQYQAATEAIMDRFREEIAATKESHRKEVDRLLRVIQELTKESEAAAEQRQHKYLEDVSLRENKHKRAIEEINQEHERSIAAVKARSDQILAGQKAELKDQVLSQRELLLKAAVERLCEHKLTSLKAVESEFLPLLQSARMTVERLAVELEHVSQAVPAQVPSPVEESGDIVETSEEGVNTDPEQTDASENLKRLDEEQRRDAETLESELLAMIERGNARLAGLQAKYEAVVAHCRTYEALINQVAEELEEAGLPDTSEL